MSIQDIQDEIKKINQDSERIKEIRKEIEEAYKGLK